MTLREAISLLPDISRMELRQAHNDGHGWCVPLGKEYIVGVHDISDSVEIIERSENGWFLARV